jgi:[protein-PII] uridylyltransferase
MTSTAQVGSLPLLARCSPNLPDELKSYITRHRAAVEAMIRTGAPEGGLIASEHYAKVFDGLLCSMFYAVHAALLRDGKWQPVTLAAVGSYGRGAVAFASDLDVRLLCAGALDTGAPIADALLYPLWDSGLAIGHQVVTADSTIDLARTDLPTATSLLDWRVLAGDPAPSAGLLERVFEGLFGPGNIKSFLDQLQDRAADRHERYGGSVFLLEPDVKNGPGGLRDLDVAHWAARARYRVRTLRELVKIGVLVPREWQQIEAASNLLSRIRNLLHLYAGRRSDRLSFDRQERLAIDLGYGTGGAGVERFMSEYYRNARALTTAREMIVARAMPPPTRKPRAVSIGQGLKLINGEITLAQPETLEDQPALALRAYDEAIRRNIPVYHYARDAIARAASSPGFSEKLRADEEAARLFIRLVTTVQRTRFKLGSVLGELHDVGLLIAMIPEFAPVVGRVHHDIYHVYTVDVHSVAAVDKVRALARGELASEAPLASRLAAEIARPTVLFFAALLHDVGKDIGGKNHSERGHQMADEILRRLRLPEGDIREVQHLILKHLTMYHTATRRDVDDPRTLEKFAGEVHGREGLRELYLLTVADVSTTSPTALTSWKAKMLDELYVATDRFLSEGADARSTRADDARAHIHRIWNQGEHEFPSEFLDALPERYLFANEAEEILRHATFAEQSRDAEAAVTVLASADPYVQLGFTADDRPGLLAKITATLTAARLQVHSAQIYSWRDGTGRTRALDLFWVKGGADAAAVRDMVPRLQRDILRLLSEELTPMDLVLGKREASRLSQRPMPAVGTEVSFDLRASKDQTVIEVTTKDRMGLLFWLANTLQNAGLTISLAKINTEGNLVADVFYVTHADGAKVTEPERLQEIKARILFTIAQLKEGDGK